MLKHVEIFAAAILVVTMLAIIAIATGYLPTARGRPRVAKWPGRHLPDLPRQIGPCQLVALGAQVAVRCPSGLDVVFRRTGGTREPGR
jgi:hypothetical protein